MKTFLYIGIENGFHTVVQVTMDKPADCPRTTAPCPYCERVHNEFGKHVAASKNRYIIPFEVPKEWKIGESLLEGKDFIKQYQIHWDKNIWADATEEEYNSTTNTPKERRIVAKPIPIEPHPSGKFSLPCTCDRKLSYCDASCPHLQSDNTEQKEEIKIGGVSGRPTSKAYGLIAIAAEISFPKHYKFKGDHKWDFISYHEAKQQGFVKGAEYALMNISLFTEPVNELTTEGKEVEASQADLWGEITERIQDGKFTVGELIKTFHVTRK